MTKEEIKISEKIDNDKILTQIDIEKFEEYILSYSVGMRIKEKALLDAIVTNNARLSYRKNEYDLYCVASKGSQ